MAVFPSSLIRLFPSSVHLANTQQVLRFNSQHSASYHAGSGFEIVCPASTLSSSSSLPSVEVKAYRLNRPQSFIHNPPCIHPHIPAIISAMQAVSLGANYSYSLDVTWWFIVLMNRSTCFRHLYAHHQEPETILVLMCSAWCQRCWWTAGRCRAAGYVFRETAPHIRTSIVSGSWWWAYECPKHVEQIIRTISHQVTSSWFFFSPYIDDARTHAYQILIPINQTRWGGGTHILIWPLKRLAVTGRGIATR
jgi:hypothetical protein